MDNSFKKIKKFYLSILSYRYSTKSINNAVLGFSLIEITIVMSILSIIFAAVMINFNQTRNHALLQDAQATVINALEQAKNRALTGVGNEKHGVHIEQNKIVIFEGEQYVLGNGSEIVLPFPISTDQNDLNIIFARITAKPNMNATVIISHPSGLSKSLRINDEGVILTE